jgi:hypothetical protein
VGQSQSSHQRVIARRRQHSDGRQTDESQTRDVVRVAVYALRETSSVSVRQRLKNRAKQCQTMRVKSLVSPQISW